MMRYSYDSDDDDSDFATAIAASAYAIHAIEEANSNKVQLRKADTREQEPLRPPKPGSLNNPSAKDTRTSSFQRPTISSSVEGQRQKQTSRGHTTLDAKADAWEKAQIARIRKWYEKMQSEIAAWENGKKLREKHQMERKKSELERRKSRNMKHYQNKVARIDRIAGGARAQVEEKRTNDESIVKEKARKMRSTGKAPVDCFCF